MLCLSAKSLPADMPNLPLPAAFFSEDIPQLGPKLTSDPFYSQGPWMNCLQDWNLKRILHLALST